MLEKEKEAILLLKHIKQEINANTKSPNINRRLIAQSKVQAIDTVLNLIDDLQRKNNNLEQKNEYFAWLNNDLKDEIKRLKKEDKQ